jgi:hypothetical protein
MLNLNIMGPQGASGVQGAQGAEGIQGLQGSQGSQGSAGIQGFQGHQGIQGLIGAQGSQGLQGSQGSNGAQGVQGTQGYQGTVGAGIGSTTVQNTITLGAVTTAPGSGTRTMQRIESQAVGDKVRLTYRLGQTQATAGSGDYLLSLPTGVAFNTSYNSLYTGVMWAGGVSAMAPYVVPATGTIVIDSNWNSAMAIVPYDSGRFRVLVAHAQNSGTYQFWSSGYFAVSSVTGIMVQLNFEIWG